MRTRTFACAGMLVAAACLWLDGAVAQTVTGTVIEGALVRYDRAARTASVSRCPECKALVLRVTDRTEVHTVTGARRPFTADTEIGGLVDTMYDPTDDTVIWFRPLPLSRK